MRVLCCCDGEDTAALIQQVLVLLPTVDELVFAYCVDLGHHDDMHLAQSGILGHLHLGESHSQALTAAEEQHAHTVLADAGQAATTAGYRGKQQTVLLHGRPGHELCRAMADTHAEVATLFPRPPSRQAPAGPHSLGHTARFVVDHAPCAVLLLRGGS